MKQKSFLAKQNFLGKYTSHKGEKMSNVLSTNEVAKNKVPDLLKDTLAVTGMIKDGIIDFAVSSNDVKASPLNDGIPAMTEF